MKKLALFLILGFPASAHATTWFVAASGGSDGNNCTQAQNSGTPKATIGAGLACVTAQGSGAGHIVQVASGTYTQTIQTWPSGTSGNPFILRSASQYGAIIRPTGSSQILYFSTNYVTVDGFVVDGVNTDANNVWFDAVTGVTFQNGEVKNTKTGDGTGPGSFQAMYCNNCDGITVKNNLIHDVGTSFSNHASHGLYLAGRNSIVDGNTFHDISGGGIQVYSENFPNLDNNIIRNNTFYAYGRGGTATGIYVSGGTSGGVGNVVYNNIIYEPTFNGGAYGISVKVATKIWNNTLYNNAVGIDISNNGTECRNNILWQNDFTILGTGHTFSNNLCDSSQTGCATALVGQDPDFVNAGSGNFHLQSTSPAIDQGALISSFSTDYEGNSRPQGAAWDIGADEFGAPPSSFTVTVPNGGESWQVGSVKTITWSSVISGGNSSATYDFSGSWVVPTGVTSVQVDAWGGGGGGGGNNTTADGGGGGGGGAFVRKNSVTVVPSTSYTVYVAAEGAGGVGAGTATAGEDSYFINSSTVLAKGGSPGVRPISGAGGAGGAGGSATASIGDIKFGGGIGGAGRDNATGTGGGGGGSAGLASAGGAGGAGGTSPGVGGAAGTGALTGAVGGAGGAAGANGNTGGVPGGGGGGSGDTGTLTGGSGYKGRVILSWGFTANVRIELSRNGGSTWEDIVASTPDNGSYSWTVAGATGSNNRVRVSSLAGGGETDTSDASFTITASPAVGTITATSLNGQLFKKGTTIPFGWTFTNVTGNVRIDLSRNSGSTWETVIASVPVTSSAQPWTAETPVSSNCQFRVVSIDDPNVSGTSSGSFRIGGSLTLFGQ